MTELLYFNNSYCKEFSAQVTEVTETGIVLDKTAFYPTGGGQPFDIGVLVKEGKDFMVTGVIKKEGKVIHETTPGLQVGDKVVGKIDWERRYKLMKMHTSAHLLSAIFFTQAKVLITGNQLDIHKSRMDFNLETMDKAIIQNIVDEANKCIAQNIPIKIYSLPREEALKNPEIVKLAGALPPAVDTLRIVEIVGVDIQADGGTHVKALGEIGKIELLSVENKGKNNRRMYFTVR